MNSTISTTLPPCHDLIDEVELGQLAPALEGYPVHELLAVYHSAEPSAKARARLLVESCIRSWIAMLYETLGGYMGISATWFSNVRAKQLGARNALHHLLGSASCFGVVPR